MKGVKLAEAVPTSMDCSVCKCIIVQCEIDLLPVEGFGGSSLVVRAGIIDEPAILDKEKMMCVDNCVLIGHQLCCPV